MSVAGILQQNGVPIETLERRKVTNLTAAEIKALRATPATLVPAPGSRRLIELVSAVLYLDAGSNVLAESTDNLAIKYGDGSGVAASETIEMTGFLDQSVDMITWAVAIINPIGAASAMLNKALVLHNTGNGEFTGNAAGDATMKIVTVFRLHKLI